MGSPELDVIHSALSAPPSRSHALPAPQRDLWFGDIPPGFSSVRTVCIHNPTPLPLPFQWHLLPLPLSTASDPDLSAGPRAVTPGAPAFAISPAVGTLPPRSVTEFAVVFSPIALEESRHLLVLAVDRSAKGTCGEEATLEVQLTASAEEGGEALGTEAPASDWRAVTALGVQGLGAPVEAAVSPGLLTVPGTLTRGQPWEMELEVENHSQAPARWAAVASETCVALPVPGGIVRPGEKVRLPVIVTAPDALGAHSPTVSVRVEHGRSYHVPVRFTVAPPQVLVVQPGLDFGLTQLGVPSSRTLTLRNLSAHTPASWRFVLPSASVSDPVLTRRNRLLADGTDAPIPAVEEIEADLQEEISRYSLVSSVDAGGSKAGLGMGWIKRGGMALRPETAAGTLRPGEEVEVEVSCVPKVRLLQAVAWDAPLATGSSFLVYTTPRLG